MLSLLSRTSLPFKLTRLPAFQISQIPDDQWENIYASSSKKFIGPGLMAGSFLVTLFTSNFAVPACIGLFGFGTCVLETLLVRQIDINREEKMLKIKQDRRMLIFGPKETQINQANLNVMFLNSQFAMISLIEQDAFKTYLLPLDAEKHRELIQILTRLKK